MAHAKTLDPSAALASAPIPAAEPALNPVATQRRQLDVWSPVGLLEDQPADAWPVLDLPTCQLVDKAASDSAHKNTGFIDFNYYRDTRDFSVMTINAGAKLPNDFEYFQLLNLFGSTGQSPANGDWTGFFTEINLRRPIAKDDPHLGALDWTGQLADGSSPSDVLRLGVRWRLHDTHGPLGEFFTDVLKLRYAVSFYAVETDGSGGQLEHVYRREFHDGRFYVAGFIDHNINQGGFESTWVTEHQAGVRLHGPLYAVAEFRYTDFELPGFRSGWGLGLEYIIRFR